MGSAVLNRLMSFSYSVGMKFSWLMIFSTYLEVKTINGFNEFYVLLPNLSCLLVVDVQEAPDDVEVCL